MERWRFMKIVLLGWRRCCHADGPPSNPASSRKYLKEGHRAVGSSILTNETGDDEEKPNEPTMRRSSARL